MKHVASLQLQVADLQEHLSAQDRKLDTLLQLLQASAAHKP